METKANYTVVGFFTVLVIALAFGFVYWMTQYGRQGPTVDLVVRIPGSANGLSVGSPVRFNGIPVGTVRELFIDSSDPTFSLAQTEIRADAPVYVSTKAVLEIQGLTGAAFIELSGGKTGDVNILKRALEGGEKATLLAQQSSVTNLLATADQILNRVNKTVVDIQDITSQAHDPLIKTVNNVEHFSDALTKNADGIDTFLKSVSSLSGTINGLSTRIDATLASVQSLIGAVDPQQVKQIVDNAAKISADMANASGELKETIASFKRTSDGFSAFAVNANATLAKADQLLASIDSSKIGTSVDDISKATADARTAISDLKTFTNGISGRQKDIDQTITDVTEMASKLNAASTRVDGMLSKVDGILGTGDANSLMAEVQKTLESYKQVADTLNAKIGPIADSIQRFSSSGLRDVEALVSDTRRTVQSLDTAISNFDKNPQRVIFGGETVKTFDGRSRR